jgi:electron-transferring-flavoprotein dehydrogenase
MGYPLWTPVVGPAMFGGGTIFAADNDHLTIGMIVGLDFKYRDFNPQDALALFKQHSFVKQFIEGGTVVEAGAKMIPEGGLCSIPRDAGGYIGKANCIIAGDSAGFVNMLKVKGLHNAIDSGIQAAKAIHESLSYPRQTAARYTTLINCSNIAKEMESARNFRQTVARLGPLFGMPLSVLGGLLPKFKIEEDYKALRAAAYRLKPAASFDKNAFTALASTSHREDQPSHLTIINRNTCSQKCTPEFNSPCITFCPAGVYDTVAGQVKPANPSNCLHCKTCQRKCPFDNIRWTAPEGTGGPKYKRL